MELVSCRTVIRVLSKATQGGRHGTRIIGVAPRYSPSRLLTGSLAACTADFRQAAYYGGATTEARPRPGFLFCALPKPHPFPYISGMDSPDDYLVRPDPLDPRLT